MLFYTVDFDKSVTPAQKDNLLTRLKSFELTTQQGAAQAARSESGHSERYIAFHEDGYTIQFIGIHPNPATRLIGAVVTGFDRPHYFALELTETHDYVKTLVDNETRLANWKERLLNFMPYISSIQDKQVDEPDVILETKVKIRHNKIIKLNPQQEEIDERAAEQITFCFGPPGTGKTLIVTGFLERCISANRPTLFMGPEDKLVLFVKKSLHSRLTKAQQQLAHCHSWYSFLKTLATEANLPTQLIYEKNSEKEMRQLVTSPVLYAYLCPSHTPPKHTKALLKKYSIDTLFQEYQHVLLQPIWDKPDCLFLPEEDYQGLGVTQSRIPKQDRPEIHQILQAFYYHVCDHAETYFDEVIAAKHIYQHLLTNPFKKFGAIAIDEAQRFNPLQIACLLSTASIEEGYTLVTSDPLQNIDAQPLAFIRPLEDYFAHNHLSHLVQLTHLETTHRSSILVTELTKIWRNTLLKLVGPDEIKTFSQMRLDERQLMGKITIAQYNQDLKMLIESNPSAMVLIPSHHASPHAWATSHVTTINEFQGLSGKTIVIDGLFEIYQKELHLLNTILEEDENSFDLDTPLVPSRHFKSETPLPLEIIRALKAFIIALSRAEEELILINPHPILQKMIAYLHQRHTTTTEAVVLSADTATSYPPEKPKTYSTREWFNRLKQHINDQLIPQAADLLNRGDIWGEHTSALNALSVALTGPDADRQTILRQIKTLLFPTTSSQKVIVASENPEQLVKQPVVNTIPDNLMALWKDTYESKWKNFAATLFHNPNKANLIKFFELNNIGLITCILFVPTVESRGSLLLECLARHPDVLQEVLRVKPEIYCSKIMVQGLLYPTIIIKNSIEYRYNSLMLLTEDSGIKLFLFMITHHPRLATQLTGNIICDSFHTLGLAQIPTFNQSILHNLCADIKGQIVFLKLLELNPKLATEITAEALLRSPLLGLASIDPCIIGLCLHAEGHSILLILLTTNPGLTAELSPAVLTQHREMLDEKTKKIQYYTGVTSLAKSVNGLIALKLLLLNNPQYITQECLDLKLCCSSEKKNTKTFRELLSTSISNNAMAEQTRREISAILREQQPQPAGVTTYPTTLFRAPENAVSQQESQHKPSPE